MSATGIRTATGPRAAVTVGIAIAAVILVAIAATGGRVPLAEEGTGGWHLTPRGTESRIRPTTSLPQGLGLSEPGRLPGAGVLAVMAQLTVLVVGGTVLFLVGRMLVRTRRLVQDQLDLTREVEQPFTPQAIVDAVDDGLSALADGPVDEVVVACWVRLEGAAAAAGIERDPSETPAELASRVLGDLHVPPEPVDALLTLYRTARYSHHPLGDADRAVAIRSLEEIRGSIARATV